MCTRLAAVLFLFAVLLEAQPNCRVDKVFAAANASLQKRQYDEAFGTLNQLQKCGELTALERFQLGWLYGRTRHFDVALKSFHSVPDDTPDPLTHGYAVALSEFELNDYQAAINTLNGLKAKNLFDEKCEDLLGVSYSKAGRYSEAYQVFSEAIQVHPNQSSYLNLITLCVDGGNLEQAAVIAAKAVQQFPQSPESYIVLGAAQTLTGHLEQAHGSFQAATRLAPQEADPRFFLALTDYKLDRLNDAVKDLQTAEGAGIQDSDLHYLLAECLLRLDGTNTAPVLTELDRAIALNPQSVSARVLRGKLFLKAHKANEALPDLEAAYRVEPQSRSAIYNLGRAYQMTGKTTEASRMFKQVQEQASDPLSELSSQRLNATLTNKAGR